MFVRRLTSRLAFCFVAAVVAFALPFHASAQNTINVPADQSSIQAGIGAANNGDTVVVAPGTYVENINFNGKAITVTSSGGPSVTIIDGGRVDSVVMFNTGEGNGSVLKGFTIQNGYSRTGIMEGGGVAVYSASPTISGNIIQNNFACGGGGGIASYFGSPLIQGNTIQNNTQSGCSGGSGGGGILIGGSSFAQITGNTIINNQWPSGDGGGISLNAAGSTTISNNVISGNVASGVSPASQGGGIYMANDSDPLIVQNLIYNNSAGQGGGIYFGVPSGDRGPILVNNTIFGNSSAGQGSAVYADGYDSQVQLFNNLMIGLSGQNAVYCNGAYSLQPPSFNNNDAFSPNATELDGTCAGQSGQNGNISADPLFVNTGGGDFRLQAGSPAVDAGSNAAMNLPKTDYAGNARILDGNNDCVNTVDMGAYELLLTANVSFSPLSLSFPGQIVGSSSSPQSVTLSNTGGACFQISNLQITGDFSQSNTCTSGGLPGGTSCVYSVVFTPTASGLRSGALTVTGSDGNTSSSPSVPLSGTGLLITSATLSPASLGFGYQPLGSSSAAQTLTLTNTGQTVLSIAAITVNGPFTQAGNCPTMLAAGAACSISVSFTPLTTGAQSGTLSVSDNATGSPQTVALSGTGVDFSLSASPTSASIKHGQSAQFNIALAPVAGPFNSTVALSCSGLPSSVGCAFSPASVTPGVSGAVSVLTLSTSPTFKGTVNLLVVGQSGSLQHSASIVITVK